MNKHIEDLLDQALKEYEELEMKYEKVLKQNENYKSILTELEDYMKENEGMYIFNAINRLQELKEKCK